MKILWLTHRERARRRKNPHRIVKLLPVLLSRMHEWIISSIVGQFHSTSIKAAQLSYICKKKKKNCDNDHLKIGNCLRTFHLNVVNICNFGRFVPPYWLTIFCMLCPLATCQHLEQFARGMFVCIIDRHGEHKMREEWRNVW